MVHADASNFAENISKKEAYIQVLEQAAALFEGQRNWERGRELGMAEWGCGTGLQSCERCFTYMACSKIDALSIQSNKLGREQLILGPFMGKVACQTIDFGRGVCGKAVQAKATIVVPDVNAFPGHIACDGDTNSEIVVPILYEGKVVGVIDCDSFVANTFDDEDQEYLEKLAQLLSSTCEW